MSVISSQGFSQENPETRHRARCYGIEPGILRTGKWNAITDVPGVKAMPLDKTLEILKHYSVMK